jgi:GcrA cell cycle regulator
MSIWDDNPNLADRLCEMWHDGLSTNAIGQRLGVSKNAVISKAHRLDLPARPSPIPLDSPTRCLTARPKRQKPWGNRPTLPPLRDPLYGMQSRAGQIEQRAIEHKEPPVIIAAPAQLPMRLVTLPPPVFRTCQWPTNNGEGMRWTFCGCAEVEPGRPYCATHCREAYVGYVPAGRRAA